MEMKIVNVWKNIQVNSVGWNEWRMNVFEYKSDDWYKRIVLSWLDLLEIMTDDQVSHTQIKNK